MRHSCLWLLAFVLLLVVAVSCSGEKAPASPTTEAAGTVTLESAAAEEESREAATPASVDSSGEATLPDVSPASGLLYVYFFDVSLGDAIYIRTPTGEDVIIDGGESRNELSAFLDALGETAVDVVVASHPHADHIGGLSRVVQERHVGTVWTNGQTYTTNLYRDLEAAIVSSGASKQVGAPGASFTVGGVSFTVLAPARIGSNTNDNSLVLRMDCGESSFLFAGDAETSSENEMILLGRNLDVDVLKLGHHGSRTSTSSQLILAATPRLAIYQAEVGNQFGHPHKETLDRLAGSGVPVFGTGVAGEAVVVSTACNDQFAVSPHFDGFPDIPLSVTEAPVTAPTQSAVAPPTSLPTSPPVIQPTQAPVVQQTSPPAVNCHTSYQGGTDRDREACIRAGIGDYDCWPGSGNGPNYVTGPVTVVGPDEFQLDTNDPDNVGCEAG